MRLGVIADTHGLLRPEVFDVFRQVDHILLGGDVGKWEVMIDLQAIAPVTAVYGPAIYDTRRGPVPPRGWGATTRRGDTVFVHVLDWPDPLLPLPPLGARVRTAYLLRGKAAVPVTETATGVTLAVPPASADEPDRVVVVVTGRR